MMRFVLRLEEAMARWTRLIASAGFVVLIVVAFLISLDVVLRWVANAPIQGLHDINGLAVAIVVASCFPLVVAERRNISIRFLGEALGPAATRWLEAFGSGGLLVFVALIGWQLALHTAGLAEANRTTWHLLIPVAPYWTAATAIVLLCIPAQGVSFLADLARAAGGRSTAEGGNGADAP